METKTTTRILSEAKGLCFGYWDMATEEFIPVTSQDDVDKAASVLGCSTQLVNALILMFDCVSEAVHSDLVDTWKRLNEIEERF